VGTFKFTNLNSALNVVLNVLSELEFSVVFIRCA